MVLKLNRTIYTFTTLRSGKVRKILPFDVLLADLGESRRGSHVKGGIRPVIVVSNSITCNNSSCITVVGLTRAVNKGKKIISTQIPISSKDHTYLNYDSIIQVEDIRIISKSDVVEKLGSAQEDFKLVKAIKDKLIYLFNL